MNSALDAKKPACAGFSFRYPDGQATPDVGLVVGFSLIQVLRFAQQESSPLLGASHISWVCNQFGGDMTLAVVTANQGLETGVAPVWRSISAP